MTAKSLQTARMSQKRALPAFAGRALFTADPAFLVRGFLATRLARHCAEGPVVGDHVDVKADVGRYAHGDRNEADASAVAGELGVDQELAGETVLDRELG